MFFCVIKGVINANKFEVRLLPFTHLNTYIDPIRHIFHLYTAFVKRSIHKLMCSNALFIQ